MTRRDARPQSSLRRLRKLVCACALLRTTFARAAVVALSVFFLPPVSHAIHTVIDTVMSLASHNIGNLSFISPAQGQPAALTQSQSDALDSVQQCIEGLQSRS